MSEIKLNEKTVFCALWCCYEKNKFGVPRQLVIAKIKQLYPNLKDCKTLDLQLAHLLNDWVSNQYLQRVKTLSTVGGRPTTIRCYCPGRKFDVFMDIHSKLVHGLLLSLEKKGRIKNDTKTSS